MVGIEIRQQLRMTQQMVMTPQLQLAIKLLQLSRLELQEHIQQELVENPFLEERAESAKEAPAEAPAGEVGGEAGAGGEPVRSEPQSLLAQREAEGTSDWAERVDQIQPDRDGTEVSRAASADVDLERYLENHSRAQPSPFLRAAPEDEVPQDHDARYANPGTLFDHVAWQVQLAEMLPAEEKLALMVLGNLDRDGYYREPPLEDLAAEAGLDLDEAEEVLREVQRMDPVGVASRTLRECLLAQAEVHGFEPTLVAIIDRHLPDIERRNYAAVAKSVGLDVEDVYAAAEVISTMEPRPARNFSSEEAQYVIPDVEVRRAADGEWEVVLNDDGMPRLRIARYYREVIDRDPAAREYVRGKVRSAQWLIRSINQRQQTLMRVTQRLVERQRDFFEHGVSRLRPLILKDIAEDLGLHESTVGRVTTNKYVQTPHGIFELKYFFNSRIRRVQDEDIASEAVREEIRKILTAEDPRHPLSDQQIVKLLSDQGIVIARRTVAKYREGMGMLSSARRRKHY